MEFAKAKSPRRRPPGRAGGGGVQGAAQSARRRRPMDRGEATPQGLQRAAGGGRGAAQAVLRTAYAGVARIGDAKHRRGCAPNRPPAAAGRDHCRAAR